MVRVISLVRKTTTLLLLAYKGDYSYNKENKKPIKNKKQIKNTKNRILIYR